jgi:hypothetical protein
VFDRQVYQDIALFALGITGRGLTQWPAFEADSACGSMVLYDYLCSVFPRYARKNRTPTEIRYRSAEGKNADRVTPVNDTLH